MPVDRRGILTDEILEAATLGDRLLPQVLLARVAPHMLKALR